MTDLYLIIRENKDCLFIARELEDELRAKPRDILWLRQGLTGLLPSALIQNELRVRADRMKLQTLDKHRVTKPWDLPLVFNWRETQVSILELPDDKSEHSGGNDTN